MLMKNLACLCCCFISSVLTARADQIEMQNGDRYNGKVLAMTNSFLIVQSDILGTFTVPREKVSQILLAPTAPQKPSQPGVAAAALKLLPSAAGKTSPARTNVITGTNS